MCVLIQLDLQTLYHMTVNKIDSGVPQLIELLVGILQVNNINESWSGMFEVEVDADEKQQIGL